MNSSIKSLLLAAAGSGLMSGAAAAQPVAAPTQNGTVTPASGKLASGTLAMATQNTLPTKSEKHSCKGKNACKGQGGCSTGDMGCKGKNTCKGKGGCATQG